MVLIFFLFAGMSADLRHLAATAQVLCSTMNTVDLLVADQMRTVDRLTTEAANVRERDGPEQFDALFYDDDTAANFAHHLSALYTALSDMGTVPDPIYLTQVAPGSGTSHSGPPVASGSGTQHDDDPEEDAEGSIDDS